jgi:hypothetical protein
MASNYMGHRLVRLMPEYGAPPFWTDKGPVTAEELGLSKELSERIYAWATEWEHGGGPESSEEDFAARGAALAIEVQAELGPSVTVAYDG